MPSRPLRKSCVLAIGGLDPGGGAGILADARAIGHAGAFACAATAVLTAQSTSGLRSATRVRKTELLAQCNEVLRHENVRAFKLGALGSEENVVAIADLLAIHRELPAVVDTVMIPTRGRTRLLDERAVGAVKKRLLPRATLVTANAPEAEVLTGARVTSLDEAEAAAVRLLDTGAKAILVKGGHLTGAKAVDVLAIGGKRPRVVRFSAPRLRLRPTHGGGCCLASLVAGRLVTTDEDVEAALRWAKKAHHKALAAAADVGGDMRVLFA